MSTRAVLALSILLALLGWLALGSFTYYNPPDLVNRWLALGMFWPTLWATTLPLAYAIHRRRRHGNDLLGRAARQSALLALFVALAVGLGFLKALNWANALLILVLIILTEALLSTRESGA